MIWLPFNSLKHLVIQIIKENVFKIQPMKKILLALILGISNNCLFAQVVMNLQLTPVGLISKEQLWNISLVNSGSQDISVRLEMLFTDVSNNQRVFTAVTREIVIPKGVKQIRQADILPITYNIINPSYNVDANPSGFLPIGVYTACYSVVSTGGHGYEYVSDECETIEVEPVSPPMLIVPSDVERVETLRPLFTWSPPSPASLFNRLNYEFRLVQVLPTQSSAEALQQNIPVYVTSNLNSTNFQYPATLAELDTGKVYAWRVSARSSTQQIANSEIWTFTVRKEQQGRGTVVSYGDYSKTENSPGASYITCKESINYQYNNSFNDTAAVVRIYDISGSTRKMIYQNVEPTDVGINYKSIRLKGAAFVTGRMYLLEINNSRKEKSYLKFLYNK